MKRIIFGLSLLAVGSAWAGEGKVEAESKEIKSYVTENPAFDVLLDKVKVIDGAQINKQKTSLEALKFIRDLERYINNTPSFFKNETDKIIFLGLVRHLLRLQGETPTTIDTLFKFMDSFRPDIKNMTEEQLKKMRHTAFEIITPLVLLYTNLYYQAQRALGIRPLAITENTPGHYSHYGLASPERILQLREEVLSPE